MDIDFLQTFLTVAESRSFRRTAEKLHISQTTVTARVQALERELNCSLFERGARSAQLTDAGLRMKSYAQEIVDLYHKSTFEIGNMNRFKQKFTICATESVWNNYLFHVVESYISSTPHTSYHFISKMTEETTAGIISGDIDLGVVLGKNYHSEIECVPFFEEKFFLVRSPGLEIRDSIITPDNIINYPFIHTEWSDVFNNWYCKHYPPCQFLHLDKMTHIYRMVLDGHGICFMAYRAAHEYLESGQLVSIPYYTGETPPIDVGNIFFLKRRRNKVIDLVSKILEGNHTSPTVISSAMDLDRFQ